MFAWAPIPERFHNLGAMEFSKRLYGSTFRIELLPMGFSVFSDPESIRGPSSRIGRSRKRDFHRQHAIRAEAGVDVEQADERLDEERCADEQHGGERDFDDDEHVAGAMSAAAADRAPAAVPQPVEQLDS